MQTPLTPEPSALSAAALRTVQVRAALALHGYRYATKVRTSHVAGNLSTVVTVTCLYADASSIEKIVAPFATGAVDSSDLATGDFVRVELSREIRSLQRETNEALARLNASLGEAA